MLAPCEAVLMVMAVGQLTRPIQRMAAASDSGALRFMPEMRRVRVALS